MVAQPRQAAIYVRISRDASGERLGVTRQLEDAEKLAADLGWEVAQRYEDNDISAYSGKLRPAYRQMLADIEAGHIDAVVAWHADRLHRSPLELEEYIALCEAAGVETRTVRAGIIDLTTATGRATARIHGAMARQESEQKSERVRRAMIQQAEQGKPRKGGRRAYGYEDDRVTIRQDEAVVISDLVHRFLAGETLAGLARSLNDDAIPTPSGSGPWTPSAIRTILRSARISGQREHLGEIVAMGRWPAIVTPADTSKVREILDDPARRVERPPRRYLLTGLVVCGSCGSRMISHPQRGVGRYECRSDGDLGGCGSMSITAEPLHDLVRDMVLTALDGPELAAHLGSVRSEAGSDELADRIARDEAQLSELMSERIDGTISREEWAVAQRIVNDRLARDRRALALAAHNLEIGRYLGRGNDLSTGWSSMNLDQRRAIIRAVVREIRIAPAIRRGPGVDFERVTINWRA